MSMYFLSVTLMIEKKHAEIGLVSPNDLTKNSNIILQHNK